MVSQLPDARTGVRPADLLESLGYPPVEPCPARCAEVLVERVVDERVGEPEVPDVVARLVDNGRRDRLVQHVEQLVFPGVHDPGEEVDVEVPPDHGGDAENSLRGFAQPGYAPADDLADALGQPEVLDPAL